MMQAGFVGIPGMLPKNPMNMGLIDIRIFL